MAPDDNNTPALRDSNRRSAEFCSESSTSNAQTLDIAPDHLKRDSEQEEDKKEDVKRPAVHIESCAQEGSDTMSEVQEQDIFLEEQKLPPPGLKREPRSEKQNKLFTRIATFMRPLKTSLSSRLSLKRRTTSTDVVTLKHFMDAASCRTEVLPRRVYKALRNEADEVTKDALVEATTGKLEDQIRFAFDVYDIDEDGDLSKEDIKISLQACLDENNIRVEPILTDNAVEVLFEELDPDNTGYIEYDMFKEYLEGCSDSFSKSNVVKSEDNWVPFFKKTGLLERLCSGTGICSNYLSRLKDRILNNSQTFTLWTFSVLCCVGCFYWRFIMYAGSDKRRLMSWALPTAKGMGQVMKFTFSVILLPVSRNAVTWVRNTWLGKLLPLDDAISYHKFIGRIGFFAASVHTFCHVVDVINWSDKKRVKQHEEAFPEEEDQPTLLELCLSIAAVTGILLYLIMCVAYLFALDYPRLWKCLENTKVGEVLNNFNNFWYTHHLFAAFYILLIIHPLPGLPDEKKEWGVSDFWLWGGVPILVYLLERGLRIYRQGFWQTKIIYNEGISSDTVTIWLTKPKRFQAKAGMYVFLNCPEIAKFEWHPYTLTSAPQDDHLRVHIASLGDWSSAMNKRFDVPIHSQVVYGDSNSPLATTSTYATNSTREISDVESPKMPNSFFKTSSTMASSVEFIPNEERSRIFVDGPYGAPCQEFDQFSTMMLIGAGIGITPFASVLRDLLARFDEHRCCHCGKVSLNKSFRVKKVYFIWVARDPRCAQWFNKELHALKEDDQSNILDIQIFITSVQPPTDVRSKLLFITQKLYFEKCGVDLLTGALANRLTNFGRPNWTEIFEEASRNHPNTHVGVFFCGQYVLGQLLEKNCRQYSGKNGTKFEYMYERF